jgi:hypothetical protein
VTVKRAAVLATLATVVTALVFASAVFAGGSSLLGGYGGQEALGAKTSGGAPAAKGTLPFTGLDLLPIVAGGAALVLAGAALRRKASRKS